MLDAREPVEISEKSSAGRSRNLQVRIDRKSTTAKSRSQKPKGLKVPRVFSTKGANPFDSVEWEKRKAVIGDEKGNTIFEQDGVEFPKTWSMLATNVVASKYFYGELGTDRREYSLRQLIHRVARTIADWGKNDGYFETAEDAEIFYNELAYLLLHQYGSFNSPVWFNCGLYHQYGTGKSNGKGLFYFDRVKNSVQLAATQYEKPQCSACFIQACEDTMEGIMSLARSEAMLFKFGSGTGSDLSTLRSSREKLSGGGRPSGPLSFLKVYDAIASVVKSGGKTRRAAKMNTLKCWHPDIKEFIEAKSQEEKKAWALIEQGYAGDFNGDAYGSVCFQNENLSVRLTDDFMRAAIEDREWQTHWVTDPNRPGPTYKARDLLKWIAEGTWICGDPGIQFEDAIQRWHTCKNTAPINSSNPCSEYMFLDNSSCNLASLNLMKFLRRGRIVRRRAVPLRGFDFHHRAGDHRRQRELSHRDDHGEQPSVPSAGARLREPGLSAHGARSSVRQRGRPRNRRRDHRADAFLRVPAVGPHVRADGPVRRLREKPRTDAGGSPDASRRHEPDPSELSGSPARSREAGRRSGGQPGRKIRLPERAGHGAGPHGNHRFHDGLRHHRRGAGYRHREV